MKEITRPSKSEVEKYLKKWDSLENYVLQERALDKLFFNTYPNNTDISDILIKASALNDFYSTNIFSIFPVAKHILNLNIDNRLKNGDENVVNDISHININGKEKNFYSFATKYVATIFQRFFLFMIAMLKKFLYIFKKEISSQSLRKKI